MTLINKKVLNFLQKINFRVIALRSNMNQNEKNQIKDHKKVLNKIIKSSILKNNFLSKKMLISKVIKLLKANQMKN